jgi:hypothetical protein
MLGLLALAAGCERASEPTPDRLSINLDDPDPPPRYAPIQTHRPDDPEPSSSSVAVGRFDDAPRGSLEDPPFVAEYPDATCETGDDCLRKGYEQFEVGKVDLDRQLAYVYFDRGCKLDHAACCHEQGEMFNMLGLGSYPHTEWADEWKDHLYAKACDGGYGIACMRRGDRLSGAERRAAYASANAKLREGCDAGVVKDCVWLAHNLNSGRGGDRDQAEAAKLFEAACLNKDAYACEFYAVCLQDGEGVAKDWKASREWLAKACKIDPEDCGKLTGAIRRQR